MVRIRLFVPVSISGQLEVLAKYYPGGKVVSHSLTSLTWITDIIPTPNSTTYRIKVEYTIEFNPKVFVISPKKLAKPEGQISLPHVYNQSKQQLCLFMPDFGEWMPHKFIAKTIIPWASEWLAFYEIWLLTGEWKGEGIHPRIIRSKKRDN